MILLALENSMACLPVYKILWLEEQVNQLFESEWGSFSFAFAQNQISNSTSRSK